MIFGILSGDTPAARELGDGDAPFVGGLPALIGVAMWLLLPGNRASSASPLAKPSVREESQGRPTGLLANPALLHPLSIFVISLIIPYTDPRLLGNNVADIAVSPSTLVFEHAELLSAATHERRDHSPRCSLRATPAYASTRGIARAPRVGPEDLRQALRLRRPAQRALRHDGGRGPVLPDVPL